MSWVAETVSDVYGSTAVEMARLTEQI